DAGDVVGVLAESDADRIAGVVDEQAATSGAPFDDAEQLRIGDDQVVQLVAKTLARRLGVVGGWFRVAAGREGGDEEERPEGPPHGAATVAQVPRARCGR